MSYSTSDLLLSLDGRPGVRHIDVTFSNPDVDIATVPELLSPLGGMIAIRAAAAVVEVVSSSAADAAAGTGARTVRVWGLDANWDELTEDITLNGTTPVLGTKLFFRINTVSVLTAGTGLTNAGNITLRDASAGTTRSYIALGVSVSEVGLFSVPARHTMLATSWLVSSRIATAVAAHIDLAMYSTEAGVRKIDWRMSATNLMSADLGTPHVWHEKTDIEVVVTRAQADNTVVFFHGHGLLVGPGTGFFRN